MNASTPSLEANASCQHCESDSPRMAPCQSNFTSQVFRNLSNLRVSQMPHAIERRHIWSKLLAVTSNVTGICIVQETTKPQGPGKE